MRGLAIMCNLVPGGSAQSRYAESYSHENSKAFYYQLFYIHRLGQVHAHDIYG